MVAAAAELWSLIKSAPRLTPARLLAVEKWRRGGGESETAGVGALTFLRCRHLSLLPQGPGDVAEAPPLPPTSHGIKEKRNFHFWMINSEFVPLEVSRSDLQRRSRLTPGQRPL